jgi:predicted transcriptional regulator
MAEVIRLTLDVSEELNGVLEKLASEAHTSKSEVLRRSINLMDFAYREARKGRKIGSAETEKNLDTEVVGLGF